MANETIKLRRYAIHETLDGLMPFEEEDGPWVSATDAETLCAEIEREALEKALERLIGRYAPVCNSFFFERSDLRAAILGEKASDESV